MKKHVVHIGDTAVGHGAPLAFILGPCVIEDQKATVEIAKYVKEITDGFNIPFIFKASYDKANRTSVDSYRGPGAKDGLRILSTIRDTLGVSVISDVHRVSEVDTAARVLDVIQIPAFLCRQTDLITAVAETGKPINIKKGQFLAPWDILPVIEKAISTGNHQIVVTERGTTFGYNNLVSDFRSIKIIQDSGWPVIFDATHSVQLPGGQGKSSGGQREFAPLLAKAAVAAGADGIFMEVHKDPDNARCDGPNAIHLDSLPELISRLLAVRSAVSPAEHPVADDGQRVSAANTENDRS